MEIKPHDLSVTACALSSMYSILSVSVDICGISRTSVQTACIQWPLWPRPFLLCASETPQQVAGYEVPPRVGAPCLRRGGASGTGEGGLHRVGTVLRVISFFLSFPCSLFLSLFLHLFPMDRAPVLAYRCGNMLGDVNFFSFVIGKKKQVWFSL